MDEETKVRLDKIDSALAGIAGGLGRLATIEQVNANHEQVLNRFTQLDTRLDSLDAK